MNSLIENDVNEKRVLIMAGGTGGHIFPGLAVATELQKGKWDVYWLGSEHGMEEDIIGKTKIPLSVIKIKGLRGNGLVGWIKAPFLLVKSILNSISIINKIKPDLVIGFGGFASGPGGVASYLLGHKLVIHEQNAIAGMTNRYLSKIANKVFLGFPNAFLEVSMDKFSVVGNPVRKEIRALNKVGAKIKDQVNVLILGGSRGARVLNQKMPKVLSTFDKNKLKVVHQSGVGNEDETINLYKKFDCEAKVIEFIEQMDKQLEWADLVICRAGASSVAEIAAVGRAAVFIPFPYAVDDHQYFNARWLADKDAAIIIREDEFGSNESVDKIMSLLNSKDRMLAMGELAKKNAYLNAAQDMANECEKLFQEKLENRRSKAA